MPLWTNASWASSVTPDRSPTTIAATTPADDAPPPSSPAASLRRAPSKRPAAACRRERPTTRTSPSYGALARQSIPCASRYAR